MPEKNIKTIRITKKTYDKLIQKRVELEKKLGRVVSFDEVLSEILE